MPYKPRHALLSRGELAFYQVLRRAIPEGCAISIKPRLGDVVYLAPSKWRTAHGARIAQRHVDFVIYDVETTRVVLAVELDDRSHAKRKRMERDRFLDATLLCAGVLLVRVKAARRYDVEGLREHVGSGTVTHVG